LTQALLTAILAQDDDAAEQRIAQLTPADEPTLLVWLAANNPDQRWWAARALAQWGSTAAVAPLCTALADDDPAVRAVAALALGHLHQRVPDAVRPVLERLAAQLADDDGTVRQAAADALARCGDDALPALAAALQTTHEGARTRAAYALRKMASRQAAPLLFRLLNDPNYMVHTYAYEALDELGLLENLLVM
jgi:HEAT repeat protein